MALLQVAKLGDPILRQKAELVDLEFLNSQDNKLQVLIDDMIETMREEDGVGLAAPGKPADITIELALLRIKKMFTDLQATITDVIRMIYFKSRK